MLGRMGGISFSKIANSGPGRRIRLAWLRWRRHPRNIRRASFAAALVLAAIGSYFLSFEYAYRPGRILSSSLSPLEKEGRVAFYTETGGNEVLLTDVVGFLSGGLSVWEIVKAVGAVGGAGTDNLQVALTRDTRIGGRQYWKGQTIDTGLDVPKGAFAPIGLKVFKRRGHLAVGITCAACHSTVDSNFRVLDGVPNHDLNLGLLLALASNSSSLLALTDRSAPLAVDTAPKRSIACAGGAVELPDIPTLETAVDARLARWPPGTYVTQANLRGVPRNIPALFNRRWEAYAFAPHGLNRLLAYENETKMRLGMGQEQYFAWVLQNAPARNYRFDPVKGGSPSDAAPGRVADESLAQSPAVAAWMRTLVPPERSVASSSKAARAGKAVFDHAGCVRCHHGARYTNDALVDGVPVASLIGLEWTAPYLRDGGVAVGLDIERHLGVSGTLLMQVPPDPRNSLLALFDRELRRRVVLVNRAHPDLRGLRVFGEGHPYWVDAESGFSQDEQEALVEYLLSL